VNQPSGVIDLWNNSSLYGAAYGDEYLINQGAINLMSGTSSTIDFYNVNLGAGTITTQPGTGTLLVEAFSGLGGLTGTYNAATNTTIQFAASASPGTSPGTPLVLGGTGQYQFVSGLLTLPTNPIPGVVMTGGSLLLGPAFQGGSITNLVLDGISLTNTLPISGTLVMTNGTLTTSSTLTNGTVVSLSGATVDGALVVSNGAVLSVNSGTLAAQVTVQNGGEFLNTGSSSIYNTGSLTNNWLWVQSGGLAQAAGYLYLYGPLTNAGTINVTNGYYLYAYNNGSPTYAGGIVNQPSGVIDLWNNSSLYGAAYGDEYLINQGAINLMSGSGTSVVNFNNLTNQAVFSAQHGTLQIQGTHLNLQSSETLDAGLNSQADYGNFNLPAGVPLAGALQVTLNGGYIPVPGNSFAVVSYPSLSGSFSSFNLPNLLPAAVWQPVYGGTTLTLVLQPSIGQQSSGTNVLISINGTPGHQAILLTSTNLTVPLANWTPVTTNTFGVTTYLGFTNNIDPNTPRRFFIFKLP
jgi:hypothetical protein